MDRRTFLTTLAGVAALGSARAEDEALRIRALYEKDLAFTEAAEAMQGERIAVQGYMAPPLKAESQFFVLTARPMAVCPFCESEAQWPNDIIAVYTKRIIDVVPFNVPLVTRGVLELGAYTDPETGFMSRARVVDSTFERS